MTFFAPATWQGKVQQPRLPQCGKCGLWKQCNSPKMKPTGKGLRSILFVAEAPGQKEDEKGTQLVGKTGKHLRKVLRKLGLDLEEAHKTNAVICRPPGNEINDLYIECCRPNLLKTIRELKPKVIVLLGGSSVRSLIPTERDASVGGITRWVGWTIPSHEHQAWICPTYHPSYILRMEDPVLNLQFKQHLKRAIALEDESIPSENLEALKKKIEIITSPRDARLRLKDLSKKKGVLAFDYESTGLKPENVGDRKHRIVACSWCLNGEDTFAHMVDDDRHHNLMRRILTNARFKKVASNLKNEERWTISKLGVHVANWWWDTMLAAHVLDNRKGITSVKFQAFIHLGIADYDSVVAPYFEDTDADGFNRINEIPPKDLLVYNGLDSLLEYLVMERQRKAMGLS